MEPKGPLAKLVKEDGEVMIWNLPFRFGRRSEKSTPNYMNICVEGIDKSVSREHAEITYSEEKKCYILEIKGKQGGYVNKQMVIKDEKCCIYSGDAISLLKCKFYFMLPTESAEDAPATVESVKRPAADLPEGEENPQSKKLCT